MKKPETKKVQEPGLDYALLHRIADHAYYLALRMIDTANSRPDVEKGEPKVGGHPTACGSSKHILTSIHAVLRKPEDYMAFKPHISPMDHALNYLMGNFRDAEGELMDEASSELAMHHLRHFSNEGHPVFQSYHADADPDGFRYFPSGSVGIPPVNALYTSLAYQFAKDHKFQINEDPTFWCVMGDSEFREGSLHEAMPDAGERQLSNLIWIVDYNRQNLDGTRVFNEKAMGGTDADRIAQIGEANGWTAKVLKHGSYRKELFSKKGGDEFKRVLDEELTDFEFQALLGAKKPELIRKSFLDKSKELGPFLKSLSDSELMRAFTNVAGHDIQTLVEEFRAAQNQNQHPHLFVIYTIKGHGLEVAAHSGNHSAMPEEKELRDIASRLKLDYEQPFPKFADGTAAGKYLRKRHQQLVVGIQKIIAEIKKRKAAWIEEASKISFPVDFDVTALKFNPVAHTQWMWGQIAAKLDRLARGARGETSTESSTESGWGQVARFFLTMAPDVGSSTNTSPNMNGKLYGDIGQPDYELEYGAKDKQAPDVIPHANARSGHIRFEIAEGNCMSAAGSFGKFFDLVGIPFYPAMTIYDFFIKRAHDQFYYNLYWHSSFATIGTPSGITLAPEGAQHSWKSDFQIPNCVTWEPCFAKELEWILADTLRRHFTHDNAQRESVLIRCVTKGLVQKDFLDRLKKQSRFKTDPSAILSTHSETNVPSISESEIFETVRQHTLQGAYALIDYRGYEDYSPGDNVLHLFAMGALVAEAIQASDKLLEKGIYANVFVVTSSDLLLGNFAENNAYEHLKSTLGITGDIFISASEKPDNDEAHWISLYGGRIPILSIHDGEPGLLDNIGSVVGVKQHALAVRKTSKSGTTKDIFRYHHLDGDSIAERALKLLEDSTQEKVILRERRLDSALEQSS